MGQLISVVSWDTARSLGLQEDNPKSADLTERSLVPVEWGTAVADAIVQAAVIVLALYGILRKHWIGLAGATMEYNTFVWRPLLLFSAIWHQGVEHRGLDTLARNCNDISTARWFAGTVGVDLSME